MVQEQVVHRIREQPGIAVVVGQLGHVRSIDGQAVAECTHPEPPGSVHEQCTDQIVREQSAVGMRPVREDLAGDGIHGIEALVRADPESCSAQEQRPDRLGMVLQDDAPAAASARGVQAAGAVTDPPGPVPVLQERQDGSGFFRAGQERRRAGREGFELPGIESGQQASVRPDGQGLDLAGSGTGRDRLQASGAHLASAPEMQAVPVGPDPQVAETVGRQRTHF